MTTPYPQQQGAFSASYTSPIPVRKATLGDALASEWTKIRSVRSTMWTLGVMALLMLGLGLLVAAIVGSADPDETGVADQSVLGLGFFGVLLSSVCVITLGVLTITSEYGTGMIRTTLTACPSRGRVLAAKSLVFFLLVFSVTFVLTLVVGALQVSLITGAPAPSGAEWARGTLGVSLYLAFLGLLSLAVGTLIRHSAGAITLMIGAVLLPLVAAMFMFAESLQGVREAMFDYSIPNQIVMIYDSVPGESGPQGWEPVGIMMVISAIVLGSAYAVLKSRDV
ncbi:ABC transporter permease [Streptomyces clavuligerus]|uniref:ABC transporter integral membrane protein n=1 Tax=Streptomyces clavuligerus TaxID=1901 RepID=B5GL23_STRCL|nr:ABC transporter permease [Streptomyces clavuligerus]ANW18046.1 ABC transporter [Streptomyces clavuligerus]AXU12606.1 ABC transporter permease [Streptomyces clavuligerus]EDY47019.1 ABC transporter integral membrane subunit [Streptomyces clavuligerus]EFG09375.1 ABC transporter integral membrane protein [Streptomyces clavuligerus]MBY6302506.1 ABC transporter permease [Streptomyces clavuligerus]